MNWSSIQFDWNRARAFLVAAEEGSFSAAGRALKLAQPTVGRQVAALEEELGVTLFERVGTKLEPTQAGLALLDHLRVMADAASKVSLTSAGHAEALEGLVCITASQLISAYLLPPIVAKIRAAHPGIQLELEVSNTLRDLQRREADIAIRNTAPTQPELIGKNLGMRYGRLYATPEYLDRVGRPKGPDDLQRLEIFGFDHTSIMVDGLKHLGIHVSPSNFPIVTGDHLVQWRMTLAHIGACIAMEDVGEADPRVERVLDELPLFPVPMWLVTHRELRTNRRIRVVFDALAEALSVT